MYRISTHGRYALRMMADIAEQTSNHPHAAGQTNNSEEQVKMPTLPDISYYSHSKNASSIHCLQVMLRTISHERLRIVSHKRSTTHSRVLKISFLNPMARSCFQICSMGFISGVYGGICNRVMFSGTINPFDLCQAAPSHTKRI